MMEGKVYFVERCQRMAEMINDSSEHYRIHLK